MLEWGTRAGSKGSGGEWRRKDDWEEGLILAVTVYGGLWVVMMVITTMDDDDDHHDSIFFYFCRNETEPSRQSETVPGLARTDHAPASELRHSMKSRDDAAILFVRGQQTRHHLSLYTTSPPPVFQGRGGKEGTTLEKAGTRTPLVETQAVLKIRGTTAMRRAAAGRGQGGRGGQHLDRGGQLSQPALRRHGPSKVRWYRIRGVK